MRKVLAVMHKEWLELRRERWLVATTLLMPVLLTGLPFGLLSTASASTTNLGPIADLPMFQGFTPDEIVQIVLLRQFLVLFLLMPLYIPSTIAAHSIVGEKVSRTLEPLLAAPLRTGEILLAKSLIAALPATLITWLCYAIYSIGARFVAISGRVYTEVFTQAWLLAVILWVPALAMISVALGVIISARTSDPRTAQQLTKIVVVPLLLIFFAQLAGVLIIDTIVVAGTVVPLVLLAAGSLVVATRLFDRERILIRWN
ncbi:MAG: ABC transporter [Herpetosiphonaceae bacterium]|nr:MAG: ABC transporter [Herpetosiphonaceae bacterium]